ncbi:MAG TPA: hypothetical protein VFS03_06765 [Microvirga sp.]|jgi:hypothetical protein|nr:hypothetical protein [Microvirga sp.]
MTPILRAAAILLAAGALAACQTLMRRETVSLQAGDAVAWNRAVHAIDPWPPGSDDTTIPVSGRRIARAIEAYEAGAPPAGDSSPLSMTPVVPLVPGAGPAN